MTMIVRCQDLHLDAKCEYVIRSESMSTCMRQAIEHAEKKHHMFPVSRLLRDTVYRSMQLEARSA